MQNKDIYSIFLCFAHLSSSSLPSVKYEPHSYLCLLDCVVERTIIFESWGGYMYELWPCGAFF